MCLHLSFTISVSIYLFRSIFQRFLTILFLFLPLINNDYNPPTLLPLFKRHFTSQLVLPAVLPFLVVTYLVSRPRKNPFCLFHSISSHNQANSGIVKPPSLQSILFPSRDFPFFSVSRSFPLLLCVFSPLLFRTFPSTSKHFPHLTKPLSSFPPAIPFPKTSFYHLPLTIPPPFLPSLPLLILASPMPPFPSESFLLLSLPHKSPSVTFRNSSITGKALPVSSFPSQWCVPELQAFCLASCPSLPPWAVTCGGVALK